jgi:hypothetical protein
MLILRTGDMFVSAKYQSKNKMPYSKKRHFRFVDENPNLGHGTLFILFGVSIIFLISFFIFIIGLFFPEIISNIVS